MRSLDLTQMHAIRRAQLLSETKKKDEVKKKVNAKHENNEKKKEQELERVSRLRQEESDFQIRLERQRKELDFERKRIAEEIEIGAQKLKKQEIEQEIASNLNEAYVKDEEEKNNINILKIEEDKLRREEADLRSRSRRNRILGWMKVTLMLFFALVIIVTFAIGLYRLYRWATEEPLIKVVEKPIEVEKVVEKEVEVEKIVEKEVIPEECTQIRRNGKVYVSCDGVSIDGAPTIGDSGVKEVPDLVIE